MPGIAERISPQRAVTPSRTRIISGTHRQGVLDAEFLGSGLLPIGGTVAAFSATAEIDRVCLQ